MEILGREFEGPLDIKSKELPDVNCAYILISGKREGFEPLYVGRTKRLRARLKSLSISSRLGEQIAQGDIDKVLFCTFDDSENEELSNFESLLIQHFEPRFNLVRRFRSINDELLQNMKELERVSAKRSAYSATLMGLLFSILTLFLTTYFSNDSYVSKDKLQNDIITALKNEGDLRAIKHIYLNRTELDGGILQLFKSDDNVYSYNIPFSTVLEDIRTNMFLNGGDKPLLQQVDSIIEEHMHINPFDRLEPIQRDYFENIRIKLSDDYPAVVLEVNKIADELNNKNTLVDKYLKDSNTSFWVSVFALMFSVIVSAYQIFNGRTSRMQRLFAESFSKVVTDDNGKDT